MDQIKSTEFLDHEWVELILTAKKMGITREEIQEFLNKSEVYCTETCK